MSASPSLRSTLAALLAIGVVFAAAASSSHAQYRNDFETGIPDVSDYQWFEQVDLDLDRRPVRDSSGYFFNYSKMVLAVTGERTTVGDPNVVVPAEVVFPANNPQAEAEVAGSLGFLDANGLVPQPPPGFFVENDIKNAPPRAEFGYGDRYELGYVDDNGAGFMIGIMDGNKNESEDVYGFGDVGTGFGSVHVNFSAPAGFFEGWRDYGIGAIELDVAVSVGTDDDDITAGVGPTVSGPGGPGADAIIDDILGNGGTFFFLDIDNDGVLTVGEDLIYVDFGDLHEFNLRFENLGVRNINKIDGVEIMRTHILDNRHWMEKHKNQQLEIGYGARLFRMQDQFLFDGESDLAGRWFGFTEAENQIVGPQIRLKWAAQRDKLNLSVDGRFMFGYNVGDLSQEYGIGALFVPGGLNSPLQAQPTYGVNGRQEETFSPFVEFRADLKYQLTRSISMNLGYNAMFIDNVTRASQVVGYTLPNLTLTPGGEQEVFINGVTFGVEFWH
ncbi:MAG: BBP7 family outer membrane beta-barrel protein [Planctomycetota bacterium]